MLYCVLTCLATVCSYAVRRALSPFFASGVCRGGGGEHIYIYIYIKIRSRVGGGGMGNDALFDAASFQLANS